MTLNIHKLGLLRGENFDQNSID